MAIMVNRRKPRTGIGKRLTALRDRLGLSQTEAALKVGVTLKAWGDWERGDRTPHPAFQALIRERLGTF